ncbi:hypothetical protein HGRIS_004105 [Hohenbuehelia grisea]|uniref:Uncharacterized protein n=1 Tax=Hohenbuehelia grisea TaxID=104357 RepID=A0ABR3JHK5_9AGAR
MHKSTGNVEIKVVPNFLSTQASLAPALIVMSSSKSTADAVLQKMIADNDDSDYEAARRETNQYFCPKRDSTSSVSHSTKSKKGHLAKGKGKSKAAEAPGAVVVAPRIMRISQVVLLTCGTTGGSLNKANKPKLSRIQLLEEVGLASSKLDGTKCFQYPTSAGPKEMNSILRKILPAGFKLMAEYLDCPWILTIDGDDTKGEKKTFPYVLLYLERSSLKVSRTSAGAVTGGTLLQCVNKQGTLLQHAVVYLATRRRIPDSQLPPRQSSGLQASDSEKDENGCAESGSESETSDAGNAEGESSQSANDKSDGALDVSSGEDDAKVKAGDSEGSSDFLVGGAKPKVQINLHTLEGQTSISIDLTQDDDAGPVAGPSTPSTPTKVEREFFSPAPFSYLGDLPY